MEYDYLPAHQCHASLETKRVKGLFFSGQLNGTTGKAELVIASYCYCRATGSWVCASGNQKSRPLGNALTLWQSTVCNVLQATRRRLRRGWWLG